MAGLDSLWRASAEHPFSAPLMPGDRSADLAILGGGYTGCSAALRAAGQGAEVVLLEAETVGHGGSGRNVGLVNAGLWLPPDAVCRRLGEEAGERLNKVLAAGPDTVFGLIETHGIACEGTRNGTLHLAHSPAGLRQLHGRRAQMAARGAPVTLLSREETAARTGSGRFHGALFDPGAGTVQPLAYLRGLARAAQAAGATIFEDSRALSVEHHGGQWTIRTARGKLRAGALIIATNAYHAALERLELPDVPVVNFFQIATEPLRGPAADAILPGGEGCWDTGLIMSAVRRDRAGRVILGGMGGDCALHGGWARRKLARLYPQLGEVTVTHAWAGRISMTADHLPKVLKVGPQALVIFGYSGRGIGPGTIFGRAAADAILSGRDDTLPVVPVARYGEWLPGLKTAILEAGARAVHAVAARA